MSDLISREQAIRMYCGEHCGCEPSECGLTHEQDGTEECGVVRFLKSVPSAEKIGKWTYHPNNIPYLRRDKWECSVCHERIEYIFNYCPNCGARMEVE